ncbi:MAG TPA: tetratricopeptide repeat protein [Rhodanobacteraceae bacterium]|nr:tetratricopeptide repeat protein [Rhodanobacteraceae bacterium]
MPPVGQGKIVATARSFFAELKRRNVLRAAVLYIGAVWALAQGIAQLGPSFGAPEWITRGFVIAAAVGFPFWLAFAWIYQVTAHGLKRESEMEPGESAVRGTGRKLDFAIIAVLAVAVLLLLGNQFLWHKGIAIAPVASVRTGVKVPQKSVAVLPFANESGKPGEQFFSDGLSEDLITALSQIDDLKVISRYSAFQFRDSKDDAKTIGGKLGVAHLLEGSVQHAQTAVRITVTLVNAADGSIVWSRRYDKPYQDLFALQDEITNAVADALKAKLSAPGTVVQSDRPPGGNLAAYAAYKHGRAYGALGNEADMRRSIDAFEEAIRLDPRYAAAYARLSLAWNALAAQTLGGKEAAAANARARDAVDTALRLDPDSSLAHRSHAYLLLNVDMDWPGAEAEMRRALALAPNDAVTQFDHAVALASLGQVRRAVALTRQALVTDPRDDDSYYWLGFYLAGLGRLDEAREAIGTAISLQPGTDGYHGQLAIIEVLRGDATAALAAAKQESPGGLWHDAAVALASQIGSDRNAADAAFDKLLAGHADDGAYQIAQVHALRRDPDKMFQWLERALGNRDPGIGYLLSDPFILRYRDDPRFAAFCKKVGLPTATDAVAMK